MARRRSQAHRNGVRTRRLQSAGLAAHEPLAILQPLVAAAAPSLPPSFNAVNWSLVSTDAIAAAEAALAAPIGCTCLSSRSSECTYFECKCTCDLTAGPCDPFCCCDTECLHVSSQGLCGVDSATKPPSVEYCATNLAFGKQGSSVDPLIAELVLCVAIDNNEVAGEYFAAAPEEQMTVASAFQKNPKQYPFGNAYTESTSVFNLLDVSSSSSTTKQTAYLPGDAIEIFAMPSSATVLSPVLAGFGSAMSSNECWQLNPVRFEYPQEPAECVRKIANLENECKQIDGQLAAAPFVQNAFVAKFPSVQSTVNASELLQIDAELTEMDVETRRSVALAEPFPSHFPSAEFANSSDSNSSSVACNGALIGLDYVIFHDGSGHLERVKAVVTIGNVSAPLNSNQVEIAQTFSVSFQSTAHIPTDAVALSNGNIQTYERSGNPGCLMHYPLRVGILATNTSDAAWKNAKVISEMTGGLQIPGLGDCSTDAMLDPQTVRFGEDSQTSCSLTLTASDFEEYCKRSDALSSTLKVNFTHVAVFGNSDPFLSSEWLAADYDAPAKNPATFMAAQNPGTMELSCQNVITSVNLEVLVAGVGPVNDPQNKIIAARAFHDHNSWKFWKPGSLEVQATKTQTFLLHTRVNYVYVKTTELEQLIPPAPLIWFSISNDVFYPFILNDATSVSRAPPSLLLMVIWSAPVLYHF
ncbi:T-complex protein 1 subunit theta, partial [Globisporangium splendens]